MRSLFPVVAALLCTATAAHAHRLDEYLQATTISLEKERIRVDIRLIPGALVWPEVLASIDSDRDGAATPAEIKAYALRMQRDLSLALNGKPLRLRLTSAVSDRAESFKAGLGEIQLQFVAAVPRAGEQRRLVFENRHQGPIAAYLVNCLVPADTDIRIGAQNRDSQQSWYQLDYLQVRSGAAPLARATAP